MTKLRDASIAAGSESTGLTALAKGLHVDLGVETMAKAKPAAPAPQPKSWEVDPWAGAGLMVPEEAAGNGHPGALGVPFETLRAMGRVPVISAIIDTRVRQVCEFAVPAENEYSIGFTLRPKGGKRPPTPDQERRIEQTTEWLLTCGDPRISNYTLYDVVQGIMRDSLTFDQACCELVRTRAGKLSGFVPVDAATIRRAAMTEQEQAARRRLVGETAYVQMIQGRVVNRYGPHEIMFGVRRPRTWIHAYGYGYPELEELIRTITFLIDAESYNAANFKHGMHVAGLLAIKSKMNPALFRAFRREFYAMLSGASNAKKTPIIQLDPDAKEELQSVQMSQSNREMEYEKWIGWLLRIACAIFGMDPAELGFIYGAENQTNSLVQSGPGERVAASKERGLRPQVRALFGWINRELLAELEMARGLEMVPVGLDPKNESAAIDRDNKAVRAWETINEVRARRGLPPLDSKVGEMILDSTYINTAWQMAMQDQGGGEPEAPEAPEGDAGEPDWDALFAGADGGTGAQEGDATLGKAFLRSVRAEVV